MSITNITALAVTPISTLGSNQTMTSREIADLTNKLHKNVIQDIKNLIEQNAITGLNFQPSSYKDSSGKSNTMYELDFTATMTLVTGYDANRRALIIKRWIALETGESLPAYQSGINNTIAEHVESTLKVAKIFGLEGNQALLSTNNAVKQVTGVDCMSLLNIKGLNKPELIQYFTASTLGKKLDMTGAAFNLKLETAGMQTQERDHKKRLIWNVTNKGKKYCEMIDTGKKHKSGAPVLQIKWAESVLTEL
ncbi:MAG: Rha family transcriptional regulator [Desulfamplus sp.]|nr:Rha family transcriptional regulator [Desulfamplus sp.]